MNTDVARPGAEIPIPQEFPVTWEDERDRTLLWRWDDIHSPLPASPMTVSIWAESIAHGSAKAAQRLHRTGRSLRRRINGYSYSADLPDESTADERAAQQAAMEHAVATTRERWDREFLPILERDLAYMRQVDAESATDPHLLELFEEFLERQQNHWDIHFQVVFPVSTAAESMAELYRQVMGPVPEEEPFLLLQGIDNKSVETGRAIQALTEQARIRPRVARLLSQEVDATAVCRELEGIPSGREFLAKLNGFLEVYGDRPTGFDMVYPSWREDPSFVILNVRSYLASPPRDLDVETAAAAQEAEDLLKAALRKMGDKGVTRARFVAALRLARGLWPLKEDHAFYIDQASSALLRRLLAEMGRRLQGHGHLASYEDVFYLTTGELTSALSDASTSPLHDRVAARKGERERFMTITPPPLLGTMPSEDPSGAQPESESLSGGVSLSGEDRDPNILRGTPGSRGTATGPAKVVRSPDEFDKVRPGDVLVCTSTSPTWTPLFGSVTALVSDSGGVLSHTAIVAREYRLPAVVGVGHGTRVIEDGRVVTVDGSSGLVHLR